MKGITPSKEGIVLRPAAVKRHPEADKKVLVTYKLDAEMLKDYIIETALDDMELQDDSSTKILDEEGQEIELQDFEIDALEDIFYEEDCFKKLEFDNNGNALVTFEAVIEADVYKEENEDY